MSVNLDCFVVINQKNKKRTSTNESPKGFVFASVQNFQGWFLSEYYLKQVQGRLEWNGATAKESLSNKEVCYNIVN